jgi:cysteine desulfurase
MMTNKRLVYLDYAAATPLDKTVLAKMTAYFSDNFFNPSAIYKESEIVKADIEEARARVAYYLGAKPSEIIFTSGATEANNLAIKGIMSNYPDANILVNAIEHESVLAPATKYNHQIIQVQPDGRVDLNNLKKLINSKTVLISVMQANNEVGVIQPIKEIATIIKNERLKRGLKGLPIYLHSDSTQAANYLDLHVSRLGVDLMSLNGGKIYGPKQTGALYIKTGVNLSPIITGGGQERNLRSGTENVSGIIGFSHALHLVQNNKDKESKRLSILRDKLIKDLESNIPNVIINGSLKHRLPNNIHITIPKCDNERLIMSLSNEGILVAAGSACSASKKAPSHVLKAMAKTDEEARSSLRITLGRKTNQTDLDRLLSTLLKIIN